MGRYPLTFRHGVAVTLLLAVVVASWDTAAQVVGSVIAVRDSSTGTLVANVGDTSNNAVRVNVVADSGGGGAVTQSGTWTVQPGNTANTTAWLVRQATSSSATTANVSGSASSVTCLASNTARRGATIFNDSTAQLYLKYGATASTSSFTVRVEGGGFYALSEADYNGVIDCIWSSATGAARVTEW